MKKKFLFYLLPLLIFLILGAVFVIQGINSATSGPDLSSDQQQLRDNFGPPDQFVVTYLPRESSSSAQLTRFEVWYYKGSNKKISFLAGKLAASEDYTLPPDTPATDLYPEDFDYSENYNVVSSLLDDKSVVKLDYDPAFWEGNLINSYASTNALFVMENNHLTYFQTLYAPHP